MPALGFALLAAMADPAGAIETVDQECTSAGSASGNRRLREVAQTFTAAKTPLVAVEILYRNPDASGAPSAPPKMYSAEIRRSGPKGTILGTSELRVPRSLAGPAGVRTSFTPLNLVPGQVYAFVLHDPNALGIPSTGPTWVACAFAYTGGEAFSRPSPIPEIPDPD